MKKSKVTHSQVMSDDTSNSFWQSLMSNPNYAKYEQDIANIMNQKEKCCNGNCNQGRVCPLRKS